MAGPDPRIPGGWSGVRSHSARMDRPYVQLRSRIPEVMAQIAARTTEGTKDIADRISEGAKERCPVGETGNLKESIHVEFKGGGHLGENLAEVGDWAVVAGGGPHNVFYGHMVELGTTRAAPHPFLLPAAEAEIPTIWATIAARLKNL